MRSAPGTPADEHAQENASSHRSCRGRHRHHRRGLRAAGAVQDRPRPADARPAGHHRTPDRSRRETVDVLAGKNITPTALAVAPIATQSKTPEVVMAAATSSITEASPYIVRTSFTLPQVAVVMVDWAAKNGIKSVVTLVTDYGPGIDAEKYFSERFQFNGGKLVDKLRVPLRN